MQSRLWQTCARNAVGSMTPDEVEALHEGPIEISITHVAIVEILEVIRPQYSIAPCQVTPRFHSQLG